MIQMVITIAIIAVVSTFGVMGIRNARAEFRKQSSARLFASYIEKARADSVRRHAASGTEASVETFGAGTNSYAVTMDFGTGTVQTRTFQLEPDVDFLTDALKVSFDWRGRLMVPCPGTKSCVYQVRSTILWTAIPVDVSGSGDITVDSQHFPDGSIPDVVIAEVGSGDVDPSGTPAIEGTPTPDPVDGGGGGGVDPIDPIDPSATPTPTPTPAPTATPTPTPNGNGNGNGGNGSDGNNGNGSGNATPTPTPIASPSVAQCSASISPSSLTLSQSDATKQTGTAIFTMTGATGVRTISAVQDGNGNSLVLGLSLVRIDGNGSSTISVTTKHGAGNRGSFAVKVLADPSCGSTQTLTVIVNN